MDLLKSKVSQKRDHWKCAVCGAKILAPIDYLYGLCEEDKYKAPEGKERVCESCYKKLMDFSEEE